VNFYQSTLAFAGVIQSFPNSHPTGVILSHIIVELSVFNIYHIGKYWG